MVTNDIYMNIFSIDFKRLRYFIAVAEYGSYRNAAQAIHISQPPLTRQVQQLEEALGYDLFIRTPKGVELTTAGSVFLEEAKNVLSLVDKAAKSGQMASEGRLGELNIGIYGSAIYGIISKIIHRFRKEYPHTEVSLHNLDRLAQLKALREHRIHIGFNRFFGLEEGLVWEKVQTEPMYMVLHRKSPLAKRQKISLIDLKNEALILYPRKIRPSFIDYMMKVFEEKKITPHLAQEVDDYITAIALVSANLGVTIVTESATSLQLPNVVYIPIDAKENVVFDLNMIYQKSDTSPLLANFIKTVRQATKK